MRASARSLIKMGSDAFHNLLLLLLHHRRHPTPAQMSMQTALLTMSLTA
eukprot:COSAG03_NODE_6028_length_1128_cov_1.415938_1_plen_48_part_10